ncbi:MAG: DNA repair protein RecN, partial [Bacteroidales bacterium]
IKNYILIDDLTIDFGKGLSVITGETGAGKSVLVGALNILCGGRIDIKAVRPKADKSVIEAVFDISEYGLKKIFEQNDIDYDGECIIRREITTSGKSRSFINDTPVNISVLKEIGDNIIDIHSQHQNLLLADNYFQLNAVDTVAGNCNLLNAYRENYYAYKEKTIELNRHISQQRKGREEEEYMRFIYAQLESASLKDGEDDRLEDDRLELSHAEEIKEALFRSLKQLDDEDGVLAKLKTVLLELSSLDGKLKIEDLPQRVESTYIELKDITGDLALRADKIVCDPEKLTQVEERLSIIYGLQKRYDKPDIKSLIALKEDIANKLSEIDDGDEIVTILQNELQQYTSAMYKSAELLTAGRKFGGDKFAAELERLARTLGMPNLRFGIEWERLPEPDINGAERALFYFSANKNTVMSPIAQSASGGEISRLMLCVKAMMADVHAMPTILFDEIDTGISGGTAGRVGDIMGAIASSRQVMAITHLPQ